MTFLEGWEHNRVVTPFENVASRPLNSEPILSDEPPPAKRQRISRVGAYFLGMLTLPILAGMGTLVVYLAAPSPPPPDPMAFAIRACEAAVKDVLRAPATAQFSAETARADGPTVWRIAGSVDAENGFSALIRNHFTCVAQGSGTAWTGGAVEIGRS